ncbi:hypothetical protein [Polymorphobacter sp.]|uniref:hypothetical protein n=1 Tax=Polymorphobacter sp. TaxID=1909290 RepID=UPI003F6F6739
MRRDTKELFGRLGVESFKYQEFESPLSESDVWPMFQALLRDERVIGHANSDLEADPAPVPQLVSLPPRSAPSTPGPPPVQPVAGMPAAAAVHPAVAVPASPPVRRNTLFASYAPVAATPRIDISDLVDRGESVRAILKRLSQAEK